MSTLTRSATLPYATGEAATLIATARRLLLDPVEVGPIRLLGVGFSGLSDVLQESLFPELEQQEAELGDTRLPGPAPEPQSGGWRVGDDVTHPVLGHGWVQGAGHGAGLLGITTLAAHQALELGALQLALVRERLEQGLDRRILQAGGGLLEALLAVAAGLDQVVQHRDRFVVVHHRFLQMCARGVPVRQETRETRGRRKIAYTAAMPTIT